MRIDFKDDAEGIFDIANSIRFLVGIILSDGHALFSTVRDNLLDKTFDVWNLDSESGTERPMWEKDLG